MIPTCDSRVAKQHQKYRQSTGTKNHPVIVNEIAPPRAFKIKVHLYYLIFCPIIG